MSDSEADEPGDGGGDVCMCRSSLASHGRTMRAYCGELERCQSLYKATASRIRPATAWMLHICVWSRARSGLGEEVSLALGCVTSFHSENRRFRSAHVAVREKEGERFRGLTARTPTEGGVGRHTSRRRESDRPEGGSGPPRGQTTDRRGGPHELGGVGTK